ncbi:DUF3168 domain-containing protein [Roseicyclus marinus]|uniref:DUF3168 domain-containing protein n=1 Tax=Roseicyclus marinus TaxID=2161673 RepID=UPI00240FCD18|nr:DUF3168 domain-containing protein [Roseicyclus marinus]MDG3040439.1 DUF3168 domain-containing protein [Roseicyclus marinus]
MEEALRSLLLANSTIAGLLAGGVNWGTRPQGQPLPAIVLNVITSAEGYRLKGRDGLLQARVQVDCYGSTYGSAKILSRAVIDLLGGYSGGGFRGVFHVGTRDSREGGSNEADRPFRVSLDFTTHWREP